MEQEPVAPGAAPEASTSEANQTNPAPQANVPAEQVEAFNRFVEANGGFEKAFGKMKSAVSNPQPQQQVQEQVQAQAQAQAPQQQQTQEQNTNGQKVVPDGYITQEELSVRRYFNDLANEPEYAPIADEIRSGGIMDDLSDLGIEVSRGGYINDAQIKKYLSIKAKTVPAQQTGAAPEASNAPTVDYIEVGTEGITSRSQAMDIVRQTQEMRARGLADHPKYEEAKDFIVNSWKH